MPKMTAKIHIPLAGKLACGTKSLMAHANTDFWLCVRCLGSIEAQLRRAIVEEIKANGPITDPEKLIDRFFGEKTEGKAES